MHEVRAVFLICFGCLGCLGCLGLFPVAVVLLFVCLLLCPVTSRVGLFVLGLAFCCVVVLLLVLCQY